MDFIEKLENIKNKYNLKNTDLARMLFDIPKDEPVPTKYRVRITDYLSGKANMPLELIKKLAQKLNIDLMYLIEDDKIPLTHYIPIIGKASCGVPIEYHYYDYDEKLPIPAELYREGRYAVIAEGDSMLPKIKEGDIVICDPELYPENGNIVHYTLNGESGIKKLVRDEMGNAIMLMPINDKYSPIPIKKDDELRMAKCIRVVSEL